MRRRSEEAIRYLYTQRDMDSTARPDRARWMALWAAMLGFMLDAMDVLLYSFALQSIRKEFSLSNEQAGLVFTYTLVASALGES